MPGHRDTTLLYNKERQLNHISEDASCHGHRDTAVLYNKDMKVGGEKWGVPFPAKIPNRQTQIYTFY